MVQLVLKITSNNYHFLLKLMVILSEFLKKLKVIPLTAIPIVHTNKNINHILLEVLLIKLVVLTIDSVNKLFFTEEKMLITNLLRQFLMSINIAEE